MLRRSNIVWSVVVLLALILGWIGGSYSNQLGHGYYYEVHDEDSLPFLTGKVTRKYVAESVGWALLDPGTTIVEIYDKANDPQGTIVYKARRGFQEDHPFVQTISVKGNQVTWEDGVRRYVLAVTPVERHEKGAEDK